MLSVSKVPFTLIVVVILVYLERGNVEAYYLEKRLIAPENNAENFEVPNNQLQISYDEYPMIVPKRAAILLDRLMVALHHALEDEKDGSRKISDVYGKNNPKMLNFHKNPQVVLQDVSNDLDKGRYDIYSEHPVDFEVKELKQTNQGIGENLIGPRFQRRAQEEDSSGRSNGRVYWRCYFNAVTCF